MNALKPWHRVVFAPQGYRIVKTASAFILINLAIRSAERGMHVKIDKSRMRVLAKSRGGHTGRRMTKSRKQRLPKSISMKRQTRAKKTTIIMVQVRVFINGMYEMLMVTGIVSFDASLLNFMTLRKDMLR